MTVKEIQKRNEKSQALKVLRANGNFFVESQEGAILYKVTPDGNGKYSCGCGDYAKGVKGDFLFQCKHVLSVLNCVPNGEVEEGQFLEKKKPKLDERFIKTIEGRDFVLYSGLLDLAHQKGLLKLEADPVQYPSKENENMAICKAIGISRAGETFMDVGDATPTNCNSKVAKHLLRMASTRAKARVLRDMTNIGMTCLEELGSLDEVLGEEASEQGKFKKPFPKKPLKPAEPQAAEGAKAGKGNGSNGGNGSSEKTKVADQKPEESKPATKPESKPAPKPESKPAPKAEPKGEQPAPLMSSAQKNAIYNLSRRRGISVEELGKMAQENYGIPLENLSSTNASTFIRQLQQSA